MAALCSPDYYPDEHSGWRALMEDMGYALTPAGRAADVHPWEDRHIPLRWRLLLRYRDHYGATWDECGRLLGVSAPAALMAYRRWKPQECCHQGLDELDPREAAQVRAAEARVAAMSAAS